MKKLVSMLLIVGIIASLFTCMTVSAATGVPSYLFKAGMDIDYNSVGGSTLTQDTFDGKNVLVMECTGNQYTQVNLKFSEKFDTKNKYYVKFKYRIDENATFHSDASKNYIQVAFDAMNWVRVASSYPENSQSEWTTSNVITLSASKISNDVFDLDFNGVKGKVYVEYIAFFESLDAAENYTESTESYLFKAGLNDTGHEMAGSTNLSNVEFDGKQVLCMDSTSGTAQYTHVHYKFGSKFDTSKQWYVKFKYRIDENAVIRSGTFLQVAFGSGDWTNISDPGNAKTEWVTSDVIAIKKVSKANDSLWINFDAVKGKVYVEYIALFDTADAAERYDVATMPDVTVNGNAATMDKDNKKIGYEFDKLTSADAMTNATYTLGEFEFSGDWQEIADSNYTVLTRKIVAKSDSTNEWTLKVKSLKVENVLDLVDFTDTDNAGKLVKPGNDRETGVVTTGNISTVYLKRVGDSATLDNWCNVDYDQTKVAADKEVYVKIAYRFGDDVSAITTSQQKELHIEFGPGNWQRIAVYGVDNIPTWKWNTAVVKCSPRGNDKKFYIGTFGIYGKVLIKYVAFFETEEAANNYSFGEIGATVTADGKTVTAAYDNLEGTNGARILAIYQGDELKGVAYSTSDDEVSITGLDAGTYTAKAFYWNNFNEGYPKFDGTEAAVTVN